MEKSFYGKRTMVEIDSYPKPKHDKPFSITGDTFKSPNGMFVELDLNLVVFDTRYNIFIRVNK